MPRELKKFGLSPTKKPAKWTALSTTVAVFDAAGNPGYCYVSFAPALIDAVGKKLPRGVSEHDPAYLTVAHYDGHWNVWVAYVHAPDTKVKLWSVAEKPRWLNFYKVKAAST